MNTLNPVTVSPNDLKPGDMLGYKIIAIIGYCGDWAAYKGLAVVPLPIIGSNIKSFSLDQDKI